MNQDFHQLILDMEERKIQYEFLHRIYSNPLTKDIVQNWKEKRLVSILPYKEYLQSFYDELSTQEVDEVVEREQQSYIQLFLGPGHIPAPPWESVYRTSERLVFGEPTLKIRKKLRGFSLNYEGEYNEPEDHIAVELEFMTYLINQSLKAIEQENEEEFKRSLNYQFLLLDDHLMNWIEPFTKDILTATSSSFYKGTAALLKDFIELDYQYMNEIKEVLDYERQSV